MASTGATRPPVAPAASATTTAVVAMVSMERMRPSTSFSHRSVSSSTVANASAAPKAHSTPALSGLPQTSSAMDRPTKATGMAISARVPGRPRPVAQDNSVRITGKVLKASSASATGMRATAEYRQ